MEFGIFSQMHVPRGEDEHTRFRREVEVSEAVEAAGFKYNWAPEHHFLEGYSHQPAPEVFLSFVAGRTKRLHLGFAIVNLTAKVNHPVRTAERIATLDHLSEGRVEFGTGKGSSRTEWAGFDIASREETEPMWRESLEQIPRMWRDEPYEYKGRYFRTPRRNVLPKPYTKPHPPMWLACSSPTTFRRAGELGLGALAFTNGAVDEVAPLIREYKEAVRRCTTPVAGYVLDHVAVTTNMFCLDDGELARRLYCNARIDEFTELFFHWLDSIPRPAGLPKEGPVKVPPPTPAGVKERMARGYTAVGDPDEVAQVVGMLEAAGADSILYAPLTMAMDQKWVLRSIETFGSHVLPRFDKDPIHSTTRQREAALAARAA